jgi:excisionase family DNA binding protein
MSTTENEYLSVADAANLLGLSELTIYRYVQRGDLPSVRLSPRGAIRIPFSAIAEAPVGAPRTVVSPAVEAHAHDGTGEEAA